MQDRTTAPGTHPADPDEPGTDGLDAVVAAQGDDPWAATRTDPPHTVLPVGEDLRRWAVWPGA